MKREQIQLLEKRLLAERERAVKALRQLDESVAPQGADGDLTAYPLHLADEGTDTMEQEQSFLLMSKEGRMLIEIDEALRRLYKQPDSFGRCTNCDQEIGFDRLELLPWTQLCVNCQRTAEETPPQPEAVPEEAA